MYLLTGDAPESAGGLQLYVGEGDEISSRLLTHAREKEFWDRAILITSKDANLTKAHARYLESRFLQIAREAQRSEVTNGTAPAPPALPEADVSDMEYFVTQVLIALPVLGVNVLRVPIPSSRESAAMPLPDVELTRFIMNQRRDGISAHAVEIDGEFTVLADSQVRRTGVAKTSYFALRQRLERDGTINTSVEPAIFARNQVFASPSAAASVVAGRSANGRTAWVENATGLTYGEWQNRALEDAGST
ncbi:MULTISPECIES: GIY-YIG nuclease family protein [unclassified Rathayibacter]|uniref:GIY-YIG nuclease family protein n=1 Tax=unclassified Rathayibacter TaxID=2609250 RepID=UPI001C613017|nr:MULTISPECIES: GIY-YIG nuclease family protein [unclassified Rathayibacter]